MDGCRRRRRRWRRRRSDARCVTELRRCGRRKEDGHQETHRGRWTTMTASWTKLLSHALLLLVSCRDTHAKTSGPTPPPLEPVTPLPAEVRSVVLKGGSHTESVQVLRPLNVTLECTWAGAQRRLANLSGLWRKDGENIEGSQRNLQLENQQYNLNRGFIIAGEEDLGRYSCVFGDEAQIDFHLAAPQMDDKRDKPVVSYFGDTAVIICKMEEAKPKPSTWKWFRGNVTAEGEIQVSSEAERYQILSKEKESRLLVHNLTFADSGSYFCGAVYAIGISRSHVELKVITFYEPLKPFLAIAVEVTVLVAAILLYERSQSKKGRAADQGGTASDGTDAPTQVEGDGPLDSPSVRQRRV